MCKLDEFIGLPSPSMSLADSNSFSDLSSMSSSGLKSDFIPNLSPRLSYLPKESLLLMSFFGSRRLLAILGGKDLLNIS